VALDGDPAHCFATAHSLACALGDWIDNGMCNINIWRPGSAHVVTQVLCSMGKSKHSVFIGCRTELEAKVPSLTLTWGSGSTCVATSANSELCQFTGICGESDSNSSSQLWSLFRDGAGSPAHIDGGLTAPMVLTKKTEAASTQRIAKRIPV